MWSTVVCIHMRNKTYQICCILSYFRGICTVPTLAIILRTCQWESWRWGICFCPTNLPVKTCARSSDLLLWVSVNGLHNIMDLPSKETALGDWTIWCTWAHWWWMVFAMFRGCSICQTNTFFSFFGLVPLSNVCKKQNVVGWHEGNGPYFRHSLIFITDCASGYAQRLLQDGFYMCGEVFL